MLRGGGSSVSTIPPLSLDLDEEAALVERPVPPASRVANPREHNDSSNSSPSTTSSNSSNSSPISNPSSRAGALYLGLNFVAAISCILVNRKLLKPPVRPFHALSSLTMLPFFTPAPTQHTPTPQVNFKFPIAITLVGYAASVAGVAACRHLGFIPTATRGPGLAARGPEAWAPWAARQPWFLIGTTAGAPLLANYSLLLNSVGVYQLSKV